MSEENANSQLITLDVCDTAAVRMLLTDEWSQEIVSPYGRILVILEEASEHPYGFVTRGYRTIKSKFEVYVKQRAPRFEIESLGGNSAYLYEGTWSNDVIVPDLIIDLCDMVITDIVGTARSGTGRSMFATTGDRRVRRINVPEDPLRTLAEATIKEKNFKNLLNKAGRQSGVVNLVMKENKLSVVIDEENANCVESFYKAGNVTTSDGTVGATTSYKAIYDFLYRRKQSHAGLLSMRLDELVSEDVVFGILADGRIFLRVRANTVGHPAEVTVVMPRERISCNYEDLTIATKKVRRSSSSVPKKAETRAPVVLEEPAEEPSGTEFSEEEMALLELWHSVHEAGGGTSTDHKQWFASYVMSRLQQGEEVDSESMILATKL